MELYLEYLRISRTDRLYLDDPLKTLERHAQILSDLKDREGYQVVHTFREVVSGDSITERPQMQKLLKLIETGEYAGVLVMDPDRLARGDTIDQGIVSRAFQITGTKIITPSKIYDPLDEFDNDYFEYALFMGRKEYKMIKKRLNRGRLSSAGEGKFVGSRPPYGYDKYKLPQQKGYSLAPNSDAATVQKIFSMFNGIACECTGAKGIASHLNRCGSKGPNGNLWNGNTIGMILQNPVYAGYIRYNYKKEEKVFRDGEVKKIRKINENSPILVPGLHEPLISDEIFQTTQQRFSRRNLMPRVKNECGLKNPLSGIIRCAKCGHALIRKKSCNQELLICTHYGCDNIGSYSYLIEQELLTFLKTYTRGMHLTAVKQEPDLTEIEECQKCIKLDEEKLRMLNHRQEKLYHLLEDEIYSDDVYKERKEKLAQETDAVMLHLNTSKKQLKQLQICQKSIDIFVPKAIHLTDNYDLMTVKEKNQFLKCLIDHVDYLKEEHNKRNQGNTVHFKLTIYPRI